jgi:hypothetical protein
MSNPTHKSALKILPVHDLEQSALTSFNGARYHLDALRSFLQRPSIKIMWMDDREMSSDERGDHQRQVNAFHWHLRGFFWEIVSAFDAILHWPNISFGLNLKERDVSWDKIRFSSAGVDAKIWNEKKLLYKLPEIVIGSSR